MDRACFDASTGIVQRLWHNTRLLYNAAIDNLDVDENNIEDAIGATEGDIEELERILCHSEDQEIEDDEAPNDGN